MPEVDNLSTEKQLQILKVTPDEAVVHATNGRIVTVAAINALDFYRLSKALGPSASNPATADLAMLAASVKQIDEHMIARPTKEADVEFTINMLGFEGLAAVGEGLKQLAEQTKAGVDAAKN